MAECDRDYADNEPGEFDKVLSKVDGVWKYQDAGGSKTSGVWKRTEKSYIKDDGVWKQTFDFCKCDTRGYCECENVYSCTCRSVGYCSCDNQCTCDNRGCYCHVHYTVESCALLWGTPADDPEQWCDCMYRTPCTCDKRSCDCMDRVLNICSIVDIGCDCDTRESYSTCSCNSQTSCPCNVYHGCNCDNRGTI